MAVALYPSQRAYSFDLPKKENAQNEEKVPADLVQVMVQSQMTDDSGGGQNMSMLRTMCSQGMLGACQLLEATSTDLYRAQMQDHRCYKNENTEDTEDRRDKAVKLSQQLLVGKDVFNVYKGIREARNENTIYFPLFSESYRSSSMDTPYWWLFTNALSSSVVGASRAPVEAIKAHLCKLKSFTGERGYSGLVESITWSFSTGATAGVVAASTMTPLDVIKARLRMLKHGTSEKAYTGIIDVLTKTIRYEKPAVLFRGGLYRVIVVAPLFGIANTVCYFGDPDWLTGLIN